MDILKLSAKAQKFYEGSRSRNLYSGYEKNVLVREDSENCLFVDASYDMQPGDVIFRCSTINQATKIDLKAALPSSSLKGKFTEEEWIEMLDKMNGILPSPEIDPRDTIAGELDNEELSRKIRALSLDEGGTLLSTILDFWDNEKQLKKFIADLI